MVARLEQAAGVIKIAFWVFIKATPDRPVQLDEGLRLHSRIRRGSTAGTYGSMMKDRLQAMPTLHRRPWRAGLGGRMDRLRLTYRSGRSIPDRHARGKMVILKSTLAYCWTAEKRRSSISKS